MIGLQRLAAEFVITISNAEVWLSIGLALLLGAGCWAFGTWVARTVGLLRSGAPAGETLGVGLASGLMVLAAWWAAVWSGGRSSFTPVAIGFAIAVGFALVRRARLSTAATAHVSEGADADEGAEAPRPSHRRSLILTTLAGGVFIVVVALLYGSTMAPSPRDGVQPVEFDDEAYYAVLGRDLATTGTESTLSASGFTELPGLPVQSWYHWGELWLASTVITTFGTDPMAARYFIVLPIVLLAAAAMTGTVVRRVTGTASRGAYLFGFLACLFLAPVPLIPGPYFSFWAVGMTFGITLYGLSAVAVVLALYCVAVLGPRPPTWAVAIFVGSVVAFILPAHIAVALLVLVGVGTVWAIRIVQSIWATHRLPAVVPIWRRAIIVSAILLVATVAWAMFTGHTMGDSAPPILRPFNGSWRASVAITTLGAGVFFAIALAWFVVRKAAPRQAELYFGTMALLIAGAIGWGALLGEFTTFYLFYGGIAVIATPVAAIAVWTVWERLRATRHLRLATAVVVLCVIQLGFGIGSAIQRLQIFGPRGNEVPVSLLEVIEQLPAGSKLAYTCSPLTEHGFGTPELLSIDAHTGRRVVPMCFEAETLSSLLGARKSVEVENRYFIGAPQRALYPDAMAVPSPPAVDAFLKKHGIGYIYADATHPNTLGVDAVEIARSGDAQVLKVQ